MHRVWLSLGFVVLCASVVAGCKGLGDISATGSPAPGSATPSPTPSTSPAPCNTMNPAANVVVGMGSQFAAITSSSPYPSVAGYAVGNGTGGYGYVATIVNHTTSGATIAVGDVVQFANVETVSYATHSAVSLPGDKFPMIPYPFPTAAAKPENHTIGNGNWSTGLVPPNTTGTNCYSQSFTIEKSGTYYFGDYQFYNTATSFRDILVVK